MSLAHYLTIGFFDLRTEQLSPGIEPTPLRPLDRAWVECRLADAGPDAAAGFWFTESGCLWSVLPSLETARAIVDHHGSGCVAVHQNQGLVVYPPAAVVEQFRVNGWRPPAPGTAWVDASSFADIAQAAEPPAAADRGVEGE